MNACTNGIQFANLRHELKLLKKLIMKKQFILLLMLAAITRLSFAQTSNAILFTENGEKFTAILNGLRQNDKPETNVKITGLNAEWYKMKIIFDNTAFGEKNFNLGVQLGNETSYSIKKNNKGEYVLRLISSVPIAEAPSTPASQTVVTCGTHWVFERPFSFLPLPVGS